MKNTNINVGGVNFNLNRKSVYGLKIARPTSAETFKSVLAKCFKNWNYEKDFTFTFNPLSFDERAVVGLFETTIRASGGDATIKGNELTVSKIGFFESAHVGIAKAIQSAMDAAAAEKEKAAATAAAK